jgi:hypothetical protein
MANKSEHALTGQALVSDQAATRLAPSGFDPSCVHLVLASQGEYSDRREWPVALYENESLAQADVERASALHRQLFGSEHMRWSDRDAAWATPDGRELEAIMGERCDESDGLSLYCCRLEYRTAQAIETRRAETARLGAKPASPVA